MVVLSPTSTLISEAVLIVLIAVVLFIIYKIGKGLTKLLLGLVINSVLGIIAIFALNALVFPAGQGIPIHLYTIIPTILFGLPAVGTFVIFKFFGVSLLPMISML